VTGPAAVPDVSVVVASFSGEPALRRCLESLESQCAEGAEVIVASDLEASLREPLAARFPRVRFLQAPRGSGVFRLRARGVAEARGRLVALTEDHCTASPEWVDSLLAASRAGHPVVGGPVENGLEEGTYDWALYLCEYGAHMPPLPEGPAEILSGLNLAYDRALLDRCRETWREAFHENEVHDALRAQVPGFALHRVEKAVVTSHLDMSMTEAMAHLFQGARRYGRHRKSISPSGVRLLLPLATVALPPLLVWRELRNVAARRPRLLGKTVRGLPYIASLVSAWSAGEALGYLAPAPRRPGA
jgi:glycosyltransferase involved in cell wall biosynthesis